MVSARHIQEFVGVHKQDHGTVTYKVRVPGHDGKRYQVLFRKELRMDNGRWVRVLTGECLLDTGNGDLPCQSRGGNTICYHVLAGIIATCKANNQKVMFCKNEKDARNLANLGGKVFRYGRHDRVDFQWAVAIIL